MINLYILEVNYKMKKKMNKLAVWFMLFLMIGSVIATMIGYMISAR